MYLKQESSRFYRYVNPADGKIYTLCEDSAGEMSLGAAWFLQARTPGQGIKPLAAFCVRSDGEDLEGRCYGKKIFNTMEAVSEAEKIVARLVTPGIRPFAAKLTGRDMVAAVPEKHAAIA